MFPMPEGDWP